MGCVTISSRAGMKAADRVPLTSSSVTDDDRTYGRSRSETDSAWSIDCSDEEHVVVLVHTIHMSARIRPVGVRSNERRDDPVGRDATSAVTRSPSQRRASAPCTCNIRSDERSTNPRPSSSASTCSQGSVVAVVMVL